MGREDLRGKENIPLPEMPETIGLVYPSWVGLGIGLNWLNRVEPSLTLWITGGVLHKMGGADFFVCSFHLMEEVFT